MVYSKPVAVFSDFLCAFNALFSVAILVSINVGAHGHEDSYSLEFFWLNITQFLNMMHYFKSCGTTAGVPLELDWSAGDVVVLRMGVRIPQVLQFGCPVQ